MLRRTRGSSWPSPPPSWAARPWTGAPTPASTRRATPTSWWPPCARCAGGRSAPWPCPRRAAWAAWPARSWSGSGASWPPPRWPPPWSAPTAASSRSTPPCARWSGIPRRPCWRPATGPWSIPRTGTPTSSSSSACSPGRRPATSSSSAAGGSTGRRSRCSATPGWSPTSAASPSTSTATGAPATSSASSSTCARAATPRTGWPGGPPTTPSPGCPTAACSWTAWR